MSADRASAPAQTGGGLRSFVQARLAALQITQTVAERRGGLRRGFLGDLLRGQKHSVQAAKVESLALALDVPVETLTDVMSERTAGPLTGDASRPPPARVNDRRNGVQITDRDRSWVIPRGVIPSDLEMRADGLMLIQVGSDAMEPDIARTDVVVIDTGQTRLTSEGTWLLNEGRAQILRRVILTTREGQTCAIFRASNQRYPDHFVSPDQVEVIGRCVGRFTLF